MSPQQQQISHQGWRFLLLQLLLCVNTLWTQVGPKHEVIIEALDRERCVSLALAHEPMLKRQDKQIRLQRQLSKADLSPYYPQLSLSARTGLRNSEVNFFNPSGSSSFHQFQASFSQLITAFGRRSAQIGLGRGQVELEEIEKQILKRDISFDIQQHFNLHLLQKQQQLSRQQALELSRLEWKTAQNMLQAGAISESEARRAEIQLQMTKIELDLAEEQLLTTKGGIERVIGKGFDQLKGQLGCLASELSGRHPLSHWVEKGLELKKLRCQKALAVHFLDRVKALGYPSLSAFALADRSGFEWGDHMDDLRAGLELQWQPSTTYEQHKRATAQALSLAQFEDLKRSEKLERKRLCDWFIMRERKLQVRRDALEAILTLKEKNYRSTLSSFETGVTTYPLVEEARQAFTEAQLQKQQNLYDWDLHVLRIRQWKGGL
jgi:outer membrane protein TolC